MRCTAVPGSVYCFELVQRVKQENRVSCSFYMSTYIQYIPQFMRGDIRVSGTAIRGICCDKNMYTAFPLLSSSFFLSLPYLYLPTPLISSYPNAHHIQIWVTFGFASNRIVMQTNLKSYLPADFRLSNFKSRRKIAFGIVLDRVAVGQGRTGNQGIL